MHNEGYLSSLSLEEITLEPKMNIEDLQAKLDNIRAWRKIELSHARSVAERHRSAAELPYLCRAWTLMIYAHCDQALKLICREYLNFLISNPRENYSYKTVWLSFFGKDAIKNGSETRFAMRKEDGSEIRLNIIANILGNEVFNSGSFSYKQLRFFTEWILQSAFDHETYKAFCATLKEKRDSIAHGEETDVRDIDDCLAWHTPAIELLDNLVETTIDEALQHKRLDA